MFFRSVFLLLLVALIPFQYRFHNGYCWKQERYLKKQEICAAVTGNRNWLNAPDNVNVFDGVACKVSTTGTIDDFLGRTIFGNFFYHVDWEPVSEERKQEYVRRGGDLNEPFLRDRKVRPCGQVVGW